MIYISPEVDHDYRVKLTAILDEMGVPYILGYPEGKVEGDDNMSEEEMIFLYRLVVERMNIKGK